MQQLKSHSKTGKAGQVYDEDTYKIPQPILLIKLYTIMVPVQKFLVGWHLGYVETLTLALSRR